MSDTNFSIAAVSNDDSILSIVEDTSLQQAINTMQSLQGRNYVRLPNLRDTFHVLKHDKRSVGDDDMMIPNGCFIPYAKDIVSGSTVYSAINEQFITKRVVGLRGVPLFMDYGLRLAGGENGRPLCSTTGIDLGDGNFWNNPFPFTKFIYYPANQNQMPDALIQKVNAVGSRGFSCMHCIETGQYTCTGPQQEPFKCTGRGRIVLAVFDVGILTSKQVQTENGLSQQQQCITWLPSSKAFEDLTWPFVVYSEYSAGILYDSKSRPLSSIMKQVDYIPNDVVTMAKFTNYLAGLNTSVKFIQICTPSFPDHPKVFLHKAVVEFYAAPLSPSAPQSLTANHRYIPVFRMANSSDLPYPLEAYVETAWKYYHFSIEAHYQRQQTGLVEKWGIQPPEVQNKPTETVNGFSDLPDTRRVAARLANKAR